LPERQNVVISEEENGVPERVRLLHIVESLDKRAVETWLLRTFLKANIDYPQFEWTFFCVLQEPGEFDELVIRAGGRVIHSPHPIHNKLAFLKSLRAVMRDGGYDIVHCHHDVLSGAYILASLGLPLRRRIIHLHNTAAALPTPSRLKKSLLQIPMRQLCLRGADRIVGISNEALQSITGARRKKPRDVVVHYGLDTELFTKPKLDARGLRQQFGFEESSKILLFVGRMVDYKNPLFVLDVLKHLQSREPKFVALFVGKGPLESVVTEAAAALGLEASVRAAGFRNDVPDIMHASDVCIWPSLEDPKEGLGLGIVEAQAAGLPVVMSRSVPLEAVVVGELVRILPLAAGAGKWANEIYDLSQSVSVSKLAALTAVEHSSFSMDQGVANIMALYQGA
jgi:glycosyltransferase involved in cell wall biosynthesis